MSHGVVWGDAIGVELVHGVPMRTYTDRPRDVAGLLDLAGRWGERPHVVQGDTVLSFEQLRHAALAKAAELAGHGAGRGDRIVLLGFNSPEWIINFWAVVSLGAVPVLGNAWWSRHELADCLTTVGPALVLADARASRNLPADAAVVPWRCVISSESMPAEAIDHDEDEPAVLVFTSGTAGRPKAVVLSHRSLLSGLHMLLHVTKRLPQLVDDATGDAGLHTGPMFHIGGIQTLLRAIVVGDTLVMPAGKFEPGEALALIERWRIARWSAVPTMVSRVLEHPDRLRRDLSSLRSVTVGGAPVHQEFLAQLRGGLPGVDPRVATGWGLTENGGQATAASGRDTRERPGSCGRPLPLVELEIAGEDGEILVRSPTQMIGYFGHDGSPIDAQGRLHTGDLGHLDADGYLWVTGRAKDMIIRGGENIAPAAVEQALAALPGVIESAVFGVPSAEFGEEVMAVVVVEPGRTAEELGEGLRTRVASFAVPSRWWLRHEPLPTTHSGKIDKNQVAVQARAELPAGGGRS
ncbi:acyl-CoA synthetase (AMP-forming)/AMP-acid ligase II [Actinoplanes lutulentus]|uniref:Acyl-CoA synthetase (AMP-forming)/AMP-acid ligase II n=1 Tax=Actinoplanes lutulentus TaxID=1287878 RepID=A0A327Z506_9ACTN|nr:AMP-binding protein [Actinoplanes lutulentus]MBB2946344.1 acyl-CoA synthetase (AMP-forming)/AMP-acid ligase II [Actinoplanes lutulentus]RAK28717.1 acyl-CoA synthetase (AMP-forming)/AMP-acid ligase II [Actinoplanes lutulentus]